MITLRAIVLMLTILFWAIGIQFSYLKVPIIKNTPRKELYNMKIPNSSGVKSLVRMGENSTPINWANAVPADTRATFLAKFDLNNLLITTDFLKQS